MSEPTDWRGVFLNDDGEDLIYEVPGDPVRGPNPLDIVPVLTCHTVETVLGLTFPAKDVALEMKKRWNSHADLLEALRVASIWTTPADYDSEEKKVAHAMVLAAMAEAEQ